MVCASVLVEKAKDLEKALSSSARCIEARLDPYRGDLAPVLALLEQLASRKTTIVTIRSASEGGYFRGDEEERLDLYLRALKGRPHYVDVELSSPIAGELIKAKGPTKVILSKHDFTQTPGRETLESWVREAITLGADVVKIATMARSWDDNFKLLSLVGKFERPVVAFAMGPMGLISRVFAPLMGAPFTYAALEQPVAPGQMSYGAMEAIYSSLGVYGDLRSLADMRDALDAVDAALMHLLKMRLEVCREIGRAKKALGLSVYDDARETEVLKRAGDFKQLFDLIVQMCKAVQLVAP